MAQLVGAIFPQAVLFFFVALVARSASMWRLTRSAVRRDGERPSRRWMTKAGSLRAARPSDVGGVPVRFRYRSTVSRNSDSQVFIMAHDSVARGVGKEEVEGGWLNSH